MAATSLLVPIGHLKGPFYADVDSPPEVYTLRVGWGIADLSIEEFLVWAQAHGAIPQVNETPWTRAMVEASATEAGIDNPTAIIDRLLALRLLQEVDPEDSIEFAKQHRLFPLMLGLGNTPEQPWLFQVGLPSMPVATMNDNMYAIWSRAHLEDNLWYACESLAEINHETGATEAADIDPALLLRNFLSGIHHLLAVSGAYVDVSIERKERR